MLITIDCRWIDSSGIGVYLRECLPFFLDSENSFLLLGNHERLSSVVSGRINAEILNCSLEPFSLRELFAFPPDLLKKINNSDFFYSPFFNIPGLVKIPVYTTIHDIIFPDMPELTSRIGLTARMYFYRRCFRRSAKIFTVSCFSKSRIEYYSKGKRPVIVTHSAIQPHFLHFRKEGKIPNKKNTIIFIGNIKKHKGLDCLLEAFLLAREDGLHHQLVIIGGRDNFRTSDNLILTKIDSSCPDAVVFTGIVSNEKLIDYLSTAALLVQPSFYEGFGLPPLEAMALGTPALISDIPVFKEIYEGFPVTFFRVGNPKDLKEKLLDLLHNKKPPTVNLPEPLLKKYTFEKTAQIILKEFV
jgi:glycosyltransferase involved in cell wall biosynthesis